MIPVWYGVENILPTGSRYLSYQIYRPVRGKEEKIIIDTEVVTRGVASQ